METALVAAIVGALVGGGVSYLLALDVGRRDGKRARLDAALRAAETITAALQTCLHDLGVTEASDEPLDPLTRTRRRQDAHQLVERALMVQGPALPADLYRQVAAVYPKLLAYMTWADEIQERLAGHPTLEDAPYLEIRDDLAAALRALQGFRRAA